MPARRHQVVLPYRPPYDWEALTGFLSLRATPGVESVSPDGYRRTIETEGAAATIEVARASREPALVLQIESTGTIALPGIVERVRRLFDLDIDPAAVAARLGDDPLLGPRLAAHPGIRRPGAWDAFELAVRAVLGQQVSVRAATTLAGRIAEAHGSAVKGRDGLCRLFPTAAQLADAALERAGVMPARARTIRALARAVVEGHVRLPADDGPGAATLLTNVPGIGPWTASYVAMRAFGDADALPAGDLVLRRAAGGRTARQLEAMSAAWRPFRSYAVMLLWQGGQ